VTSSVKHKTSVETFCEYSVVQQRKQFDVHVQMMEHHVPEHAYKLPLGL